MLWLLREKLQPYNEISAAITKERIEKLPEISIVRNPSVLSQCKSPYSGETIQQLSRYEVIVNDGKPYKVIKPRVKNVTWHEPTLGIRKKENVLCALCKQWGGIKGGANEKLLSKSRFHLFLVLQVASTFTLIGWFHN